MRVFLWFVAGTIVGYLGILFGWIAYADVFAVGDMDGGKGMEVAFIVAPAGAVVIGIVLAVAFGRKRAVTPLRQPD